MDDAQLLAGMIAFAKERGRAPGIPEYAEYQRAHPEAGWPSMSVVRRTVESWDGDWLTAMRKAEAMAKALPAPSAQGGLDAQLRRRRELDLVCA